jgi:heptosyltransferase-1
MTAAPSTPTSGPRVLVIKLSSLGDLFHALPAVQRIKDVLHARIDWVTQKEYAGLVACFGVADRVIAFPRRGGARERLRFLRELRRERYDYVIDFQGLLKSALIGWAARARERIGPSFQREGAFLFYHRIAGIRNKNRHAVEENLEIAEALGCPPGPVELALRFPPFEPTEPAPRVAVSPVSRWESKNWPASSFVEVLQRLQAERGAAVYLMGGPMERYLCEGMAARLKGPVFNLAGSVSLAQMGGVLQAMDLVLANDTGPIHMAAALGVPVLAVFGPTDPLRTGPHGSAHRVLSAAGLDCRPCLSRWCRRAEAPLCMAGVTPDEVTAAALGMLDAAAAQKLVKSRAGC